MFFDASVLNSEQNEQWRSVIPMVDCLEDIEPSEICTVTYPILISRLTPYTNKQMFII